MTVKRLSAKRYDSDAVQGEGSYVVLMRPNMRQMKEVMSANKANGHTPTEEERNLANLEAAIKLVGELLIEWNWVDEEGKALPLPRKDKKIMESLTDLEVNFLAGLLNPNQAEEADQKKELTH